MACYSNSRRLHDGTFLLWQIGHTKVPLPRPQNLTPPLERPSRISLSSSNSESSEYEFLISESLCPAMLAETVEERKRKINCKILQVQSGEKATHHTPFLYEAMVTIHMATSTSLGASFPSIRLVVYPTCPLNDDHSLGNIEFPRRVFHIAWPSSVPKAFKNIGNPTATMVIN